MILHRRVIGHYVEYFDKADSRPRYPVAMFRGPEARRLAAHFESRLRGVTVYDADTGECLVGTLDNLMAPPVDKLEG